MNCGETKLELWLEGDLEDPSLRATEFDHPWSPHKAVRMNSNPSDATTAQLRWTAGVQALTVFLLRWAAWARLPCEARDEAGPVFAGLPGTAPCSLAQALQQKNNAWLTHLFGTEEDGATFAGRFLSTRSSGRKRPHLLLVHLDSDILPPEQIRVLMNDEQIDDPATLEALAAAIEKRHFKRRTRRKVACGTVNRASLATPCNAPEVRVVGQEVRAIEFDTHINALLQDFQSRPWLRKRIQSLLQSDAAPANLVVGGPGSGKSAMMANLVQEPLSGVCYAAHHFCLPYSSETQRPSRFVQSLAAHLSRALPVYRAALREGNIGDSLSNATSVRDPLYALRTGVLSPLRRLSRSDDSQIVILVDGVDEGRVIEGGVDLVRLLAMVLDEFPPWIRLILTSRSGSAAHRELAGRPVLDIGADRERCEKDISAFVAHRMQQPALARNDCQARAAKGSLRQRICQKSAGNFLYAKHVLDALESGVLGPSDLDRLPPGLGALYGRFIARDFPMKEQYAEARPVLEVLVAAQEPLSETELIRATRGHREASGRALDVLAPYAHMPVGESDHRWYFYHSSIVEWLTDRSSCGASFVIDAHEGHRRLAETGLCEYETNVHGMSAYAARNLITHLVCSGSLDRAIELLTNLHFIEKRLALEDHGRLLSDYDETTRALPELQATLEILGENRKALTEYAAALSTIASRAGRRHSRDSKQAETPRPPRAWSEVKSPNHVGSAGEAAPRLEALRAFAGFLTAEEHHLARGAKHQGFVLQHAYNSVDSGPVGRAAERMVGSGGPPMLLRKIGRTPYEPTPAPIRTLRADTRGYIQSVAMSLDGTRIVTGGDDHVVRVWDADTAHLLMELAHHKSMIRSLALSADGNLAASGDDRGILCFWDLREGRIRWAHRTHDGPIWSIALSADGSRLVSTAGPIAGVWRTDKPVCLRHLVPPHRGETRSVALSPNGRLAVSGHAWDSKKPSSIQQLVNLWEIQTGQLLESVVGLRWSKYSQASYVDLSHDCRWIAALMRSGDVYVWDRERRMEWSAPLAQCEGWPIGMRMTPDGSLVAAGFHKGALHVWDTKSQRELRSFAFMFEGHGMAISVDGRTAVTCGGVRDALLWDLENGQSRVTPEETRDAPLEVHQLLRTGNVFSLGWETARTWNQKTGSLLSSFSISANPFRYSVLSSDHRWGLIFGNSDEPTVLNLERCAPAGVLRWDWDGAFLPDQNLVVSTGLSGRVRKRSLGGRKVTPIVWSPRTGGSPTLLPDGRYAIVTRAGDSFRLLDLEERRCLYTRLLRTNDECAHLTPDGQAVLFSTSEGNARVFDVPSAWSCLNLRIHRFQLASCVFGFHLPINASLRCVNII